MIDVNELHKTVNLMHQKQDGVIHTLNQQTAYFKQPDGNIKFTHQAMVNLSATIRNFAENTQATFQEIASKLDLGV
jgi:GTP cyclohydrolase II